MTVTPASLSLKLVASGTFALVNGTPVFLTWNVPNDNQNHRFMVAVSQVVTGAETGGQVSVTATPPGGAAVSTPVVAPNNGIGTNLGNSGARQLTPAAPGTTVTVAQSSALTAGAATVYAEIWGT